MAKHSQIFYALTLSIAQIATAGMAYHAYAQESVPSAPRAGGFFAVPTGGIELQNSSGAAMVVREATAGTRTLSISFHYAGVDLGGQKQDPNSYYIQGSWEPGGVISTSVQENSARSLQCLVSARLIDPQPMKFFVESSNCPGLAGQYESRQH